MKRIVFLLLILLAGCGGSDVSYRYVHPTRPVVPADTCDHHHHH